MKKIICLVLAVIMSVSMMALPTPVMAQSRSSFIDVIGTKDEWANEYIEKMVSQGVIIGIDYERFEPSRMLKREELAKIVVLYSGSRSYADTGVTFEDVPDYQWYTSYIFSVIKSGYMKGVSEKTFGVGQGLKRCDLALLMARFDYDDEELASFEEKIPETVKDKDEIPSYAKGAMGYCYEKGLITGDEKGNLNPLDFVTRAQIAKVFSVYFDSREGTGEITLETELLDPYFSNPLNTDNGLKRLDISAFKLSPKTQYNIKAAMCNYSFKNFSPDIKYLYKSAHNIIKDYIGKTSDGYYVLKLKHPWNYSMWGRKITYKIAGEDFISPYADTAVYIYKQGYLEDLQKAYEKGEADIETVKSVSKLVMEKYKDLKEMTVYEPTKECPPEMVNSEINRRELEGIISAETEIQIKKALYEYYNKYEYPILRDYVMDQGERLIVGFSKFYGQTPDGVYFFGDAGPVIWNVPAQVGHYSIFGNIVIAPMSVFPLLVYKDGTVYDVCDAYSKGIINDDSIEYFYKELYYAF